MLFNANDELSVGRKPFCVCSSGSSNYSKRSVPGIRVFVGFAELSLFG